MLSVEVLRYAQKAGFTLDEIRRLFRGFDAKSPLGSRWRALAEAKLRELDALQAQIAQMRQAIETGLACGCLRIEDCILALPSGSDGVSSRSRKPRLRSAT